MKVSLPIAFLRVDEGRSLPAATCPVDSNASLYGRCPEHRFIQNSKVPPSGAIQTQVCALNRPSLRVKRTYSGHAWDRPRLTLCRHQDRVGARRREGGATRSSARYLLPPTRLHLIAAAAPYPEIDTHIHYGADLTKVEGKRMSSTADCSFKATLVGVGGTIVLDLYALIMSLRSRRAGNQLGNGRPLVRRLAQGQFVQGAMSQAAPFKGELAIGWIAHYAIGICYGLLLLALYGKVWLERPTPLPPMILAWVLLVAPYLVMMPGMGMGIAGSRTPKPNITRLKSVMGHSVSGLGMYATGWLLASYWPTPA